MAAHVFFKKASRKRETNLVVFLLFVACLSLAMLSIWSVWLSRGRVLNDAELRALNLAKALDSYAESVINKSSLLLYDLVEHLEKDGVEFQKIIRLRDLVDNRQHLMAPSSSVTIYDEKGGWVMSSAGSMLKEVNSSDREFFSYHLNNRTENIFIGPPAERLTAFQWVVTVSKRFNDKDGRFAGVVVITLAVEDFLGVFGAVDLGSDGVVVLTNGDGRTLVRYPLYEQSVGWSFSESIIHLGYLVDSMVASTRLVSSVDGVERIYAFRKNRNLPLVVTVAVGVEESLASWRLDAERIASAVLILMLFVGLINVVLIVNVKNRDEVESDLIDAREELLKVNNELEELVSIDHLTGLFNRRSFDEVLSKASLRACRDGCSLSLLIIDVDYFKRFNDFYGHLLGDECLKKISLVLKRCSTRELDFVARYGGEEIAIILPDTDILGAISIAKNALDAVHRLGVAHVRSPLGRVTVSIGLACMEGGELIRNELMLIEAADKAMYEAKASGRNCYKVFKIQH